MTISEAEKILGLVKEDPSLVDLQSAFYHNVKPYHDMSFAQRKCVFLNKEGRCGIYENRPLICRTHNVSKGVNIELCKRLTGEKTDEIKSSIIDAFMFFLTEKDMQIVNLNQFISKKISK